MKHLPKYVYSMLMEFPWSRKCEGWWHFQNYVKSRGHFRYKDVAAFP